MRVAIIQSSYIPWKGFFDLIGRVDHYVLYDTVQYTRRDWRNRNQIKTQHGLKWLTIPVETKGRYLQKINETRISDPSWAGEHWRMLRESYAQAPHMERYGSWLESLYLDDTPEMLSQVNERFIRAIAAELGIATEISSAADDPARGKATSALVSICRELGAPHYLSGPSARAYLQEEEFSAAGIEVEYMDYAGYPEYPQLHPPFEHAVTVLDLLLSVGPEAPLYLKPAR